MRIAHASPSGSLRQSGDASIVLGESSYFRRLDLESPLDIKLRADLPGRTVMFIGYSLADVNIRYLFYSSPACGNVGA